MSSTELDTLKIISENTILNISEERTKKNISDTVIISVYAQPIKTRLTFADTERRLENTKKISTNTNFLAIVPMDCLYNTSSVLTRRSFEMIKGNEDLKMQESIRPITTNSTSSKKLRRILNIKGGMCWNQNPSNYPQHPIEEKQGLTTASRQYGNIQPPPPPPVGEEQTYGSRFIEKEQDTLSSKKIQVQSSSENSFQLKQSYLLSEKIVPFDRSRKAISKWAANITENDISILYTAVHNCRVKYWQLRAERERIVNYYETAKSLEVEEYSKVYDSYKFSFKDKMLKPKKLKKLNEVLQNQLQILDERRNKALENIEVEYQRNESIRKSINRCLFHIGHPRIQKEAWYSLGIKDSFHDFWVDLRRGIFDGKEFN